MLSASAHRFYSTADVVAPSLCERLFCGAAAMFLTPPFLIFTSSVSSPPIDFSVFYRSLIVLMLYVLFLVMAFWIFRRPVESPRSFISSLVSVTICLSPGISPIPFPTRYLFSLCCPLPPSTFLAIPGARCVGLSCLVPFV